ncbi:MAG: isoleucine--tRNA ligase [Robiginitomaculum sp.]|nr:MAG: isoleucine--tRNA ligase [Robiginitomaculum sp.]
MTDSTSNPPGGRDYRDTLFLPKTDFPMRAGLPKKEPEWLAHWDKIDLYNSLRKQSADKPQYVLHDGPPYANGHIHMGTAMNKILKDMVVKAHQMLGYNANYVPGWDCHGLPIEWKVEEEFRSKGRSKDDVPGGEFRKRCREYAAGWLDIQREEFKRLGVIGDWENPYMTMKFESEAIICAELLKIAKSGQLYRGSKPIMWSPVERTALAEAEVEYADRRATQIYVKFPVTHRLFRGGFRAVNEPFPFAPISDAYNVEESWPTYAGASVVIWTTTPWTIPANRAVSYATKIEYGLYEIIDMEEAEFEPWSKPGDKLIVAKGLWKNVAKAGLIKSAKLIRSLSANELEDLVLSHPLKNMDGAEGKFDFPVPLLEGSHVTAEAGTGFVHTAPSHGEDDYVVWISNQTKLEALGIDPIVPMTLDDDGCYTDVMPARLQGLDVIRTSGKKRGQDGKANPEVLKALMECGNLLARGITKLRDAHSWRSKAPVIRRATPQWFVSMSKGGLRDKAIAEIEKTEFIPPRGKNRLLAMVQDRPDWLISRQRNWGVPITLMVHTDGRLHTELPEADAINARILAAVKAVGVDGWFDADIADLMGDVSASGWEKVTDILDVWFDSGSTHAFCLKQRDDLKDRADLYLEGSDQHRGWFQSSLLESCANYGEAPYDAVLTHGFVMAKDGRKMSKSLGNTIAPEQIIRQYGADILRLWVASSDFTDDLRIGDEIIKTAADAYRKLRNTLRYMIGALDGYDASDAVEYGDMPALEKWVLHRLSELDALVKDAYKKHDFKKVYAALFNFCTNDLSAFYFDVRKDALYCDPLDSTRRKACRTVMDKLWNRLTLWLAPVLSFTTEEVWQTRYGNDGSVHLHEFPDTPDDWNNAALAKHMHMLITFRSSVAETTEPLRKDGVIKSSLEARVIAPVENGLISALTALGITRKDVYPDPKNPVDTLADYLIVSECDLSSQARSIDIHDLKSDGFTKCQRSWKYFKAQGSATITPRDVIAVEQWVAKHG